MENTRLELLLKKDELSYAQGSPLLLEAYALHKDNVTGDRVAQLKWKNIDSRCVKAVMVGLIAYDAFNNKTGTVQYQYDGLNVEQGKEFGSKSPIIIRDDKVSRFDVVLRAVSFTDGGIWQGDTDYVFKPLPGPEPQKLSGELADQLLRDLTDGRHRAAVQYKMQNIHDL